MLIAISQKETVNKHGDFISSLENQYVNYLEGLGINLIPISNATLNLYRYLKLPLEGVILSGGNNINPELYGQKNDAKSVLTSINRDKIESQLLKYAIEKRLPVLGICRGMQFINVYFGGRIQYLRNSDFNHVGTHHNVSLRNVVKDILGSEKIFGDKNKLDSMKVNSYHNYGIKPINLSPKLRAFSECADGTIEGIYHADLPIAGIMWHPERKNDNEIFNRLLIQSFINGNSFWDKKRRIGVRD